jgi:hypothetical protein
MPQVESEPTTPVFERVKTVHALDRAACERLRLKRNRYDRFGPIISVKMFEEWNTSPLIIIYELAGPLLWVVPCGQTHIQKDTVKIKSRHISKGASCQWLRAPGQTHQKHAFVALRGSRLAYGDFYIDLQPWAPRTVHLLIRRGTWDTCISDCSVFWHISELHAHQLHTHTHIYVQEFN